MEEYKEGDIFLTFPCFHIYHKHCAVTWLNLKNTCPLCNSKVVENGEDI